MSTALSLSLSARCARRAQVCSSELVFRTRNCSWRTGLTSSKARRKENINDHRMMPINQIAPSTVRASVARATNVDKVATQIANRNANANAPINFGSALSRRNSPCGILSMFTCMANSTSVATIAAAPISADQMFNIKPRRSSIARAVAKRVSITP